MRTFLQLFKKAMGLPLLVWFALFYLWRFILAYCMLAPVEDVEIWTYVFVVVILIGIVIKLWFIGYLFCVASRISAGSPKPLYPLGLKTSFVMGIRVFNRLIFVLLPLITTLIAVALINEPIAEGYFNVFRWFYIVFFFVPFCLYFVANSGNLPCLFTWEYFKKNLDLVLAFIFSCGFVHYAWIFNTQGMLSLMGNVYVFSWKEEMLTTAYNFLDVYRYAFVAVLLGYLAGKTREVPDEAPVVEPVTEAKVTETVKEEKSVASAKKPASEKKKTVKKVATKKATSKTASKKTAAPKTATKKTVAQKPATKKAKGKTVKK